MAPGELQVWSCSTRGWERRFFFVRFSYAFKALLIIELKLEEDEVVLWVWDIRLGRRSLWGKRNRESYRTPWKNFQVTCLGAFCERAAHRHRLRWLALTPQYALTQTRKQFDIVCSMDGVKYVDGLCPRRSLVHVLYSYYHLYLTLFHFRSLVAENMLRLVKSQAHMPFQNSSTRRNSSISSRRLSWNKQVICSGCINPRIDAQKSSYVASEQSGVLDKNPTRTNLVRKGE